MSSLPVTSSNSMPITMNSSNLTCGSGITLSNANSVSGTLTVNSSGNLMRNDQNTIHTFSKDSLENIIKEFYAGKYTRKYVEVYLDFMVMNAMLDNLEYLEYKVSLDKELPK